MDKDIFNENKSVRLTFRSPDGAESSVVVDRGAQVDGEREFLVEVGQMLAARSGRPFPEASISIEQRTFFVPLPPAVNSAAQKHEEIRNVLEAAAKLVLRATLNAGAEVAVLTDAGPVAVAAEAVPTDDRREISSETVGTDGGTAPAPAGMRRSF